MCKIKIYLLWLAFCSLLAGCSPGPYNRAANGSWIRHVVVADERGKFDHRVLPSSYRCSWTAEGNPRGRPQAEDCHFEFLFDRLGSYIDSNKDPKLLVFIHGGLTTPHIALSRVESDYQEILDSGHYPIFLNWQSGGLISYFDQITEVRDGIRIQQYRKPSERNLLRSATPFYLLADVTESAVTAPVTWFNQAVRAVSRRFREAQIEANAESYLNQSWRSINHNNNVIQEYAQDTRSFMNPGEIFTPFLYLSKMLTAPFIDNMGETAWSNMRRSSRAVFRTHLDYDQTRLERRIRNGECPNKLCQDGTGSFAAFFQRLERFFESSNNKKGEGNERRKKTEVNLVAHSMGTIVANDAIRDFNLQYDNIVYLGAASSIRHFYNTVIPVLEGQSDREVSRKTRFYNLMLHPKAEQREQNYLGLLPSGSLLEWIDNMYVESDSIFDRTLGNWNNVSRVKHAFSEEAQRRMLFKIFPKFENDSFPYRHGDFTRTYRNGENEITYSYWDEASWGSRYLIGDR
jgi:hypothetical protein